MSFPPGADDFSINLSNVSKLPFFSLLVKRHRGTRDKNFARPYISADFRAVFSIPAPKIPALFVPLAFHCSPIVLDVDPLSRSERLNIGLIKSNMRAFRVELFLYFGNTHEFRRFFNMFVMLHFWWNDRKTSSVFNYINYITSN